MDHRAGAAQMIETVEKAANIGPELLVQVLDQLADGCRRQGYEPTSEYGLAIGIVHAHALIQKRRASSPEDNAKVLACWQPVIDILGPWA